MMASSNTHSVFVSTSCLQEVQSLTSRLSLYYDSGLDAIELGSGVIVSKNCLYRVKEIERPILVHNYFPPPSIPFVLNLASSDKKIRQQSIDFVSEALDLTAQLNAPFYSVHAGFVTDPISFDTYSFVFPTPSLPDDAICASYRFNTAVEILLNNAENLGICLLIENNICSAALRGKLLLQTANEFMELFHNIHSPHLGILLDTGHLNLTAHTLGIDPTSFVDQVAPYIRAFHVHDNDGIVDSHQPVQPGSWVLEVLRRPEFANLPIIVEAKFENVADLRQHVDWLKMEIRHE